ncbi:MAG TPA: hypothetical protein VFK87_03620 [Steroidobacteraceae bacterium]|nr:hypothetical protein [Steroidobacteraceae bacterium]
MSSGPREMPQPQAESQALAPAAPPAERPAAVVVPLPALAPRTEGPVATRGAAALARAQAAAGQIVPQLQYQVMRLGLAGQAGLAALTAAVAVAIGALIPAYHAMQTVSADLARVQHAPAGYSMEQAVPRLMASLPTRGQMPAVLAQVYAEAKAAGVPLDTGRYVFTPAKSGTVAHYNLEFPVKGAGYPQIRTFINRTLTVVPAASLDKLQVERKAVGEQAVNADIGFVVFVRSGDAP